MTKRSKLNSALRKDPRMICGLIVLIFTLSAALVGPFLFEDPAHSADLSLRLLTPSRDHPLGCDLYGKDLLSSMLYGARVSLLIAFLTVLLSSTIGILAGLVSGFFGSKIDSLIMRVVDIMMAFPGLLLAMSLTALMGPSLQNIVLSMVATGWTSTARLVRGQVLSLKHREFILASKALGASPLRTLFRHILPSLLSPLLVHSTFSISGVILMEAGLSFLGFGTSIETDSWGALLNQGKSVLSEAPHLSIFPGLAIFTLVLAFNFIGDALRDLSDPRNR
ncbi:MAG: ABC transporter permease [Oligoflexales bacterium]|nr:ABC transporter permease [Oligoflexales bacterium]